MSHSFYVEFAATKKRLGEYGPIPNAVQSNRKEFEQLVREARRKLLKELWHKGSTRAIVASHKPGFCCLKLTCERARSLNIIGSLQDDAAIIAVSMRGREARDPPNASPYIQCPDVATGLRM